MKIKRYLRTQINKFSTMFEVLETITIVIVLNFI